MTMYIILHIPMSLSPHFLSQTYSVFKHNSCRNCNQHNQSVTKQKPCDKPPSVITLIGSKHLNQAVRYHRKHDKNCRKYGSAKKETGEQRDYHPHQFSCTSGTNRKLFPFIMKGSFFPTMAPKNNRKPFIQPSFHIQLSQYTCTNAKR